MLESGRLKVYLHVPASTPIGTVLNQLSWITSDETDLTPDNNAHIAARTVVGSFDPNFKEVTPEKGLTELEIAEGTELMYTIHFQNTGNYPAEIVRITDKIDTALFLPSIRLVASSHDVTSFELKPGGLLEITFENIQLPDSISNEAESHGFVTFAVQRKAVYSKTQPVLNKANIHFDFNDPVITNQVAFTIRQSDPVSTSETSRREQLKIYPNPSPGNFVLLYPESMAYPVTMSILDLHGRLVHQRKIDPGRTVYQEMFEMAAGTYLVQVSDQKQTLWGRVVIHAGE
jgi:hypothetical protein